MNFWLWMLLAYLGGNISMAFVYALVKRSNSASFDHNHWD